MSEYECQNKINEWGNWAPGGLNDKRELTRDVDTSLIYRRTGIWNRWMYQIYLADHIESCEWPLNDPKSHNKLLNRPPMRKLDVHVLLCDRWYNTIDAWSVRCCVYSCGLMSIDLRQTRLTRDIRGCSNSFQIYFKHRTHDIMRTYTMPREHWLIN